MKCPRLRHAGTARNTQTALETHIWQGPARPRSVATLKCPLRRQAGAARNKHAKLDTHMGHADRPKQRPARSRSSARLACPLRRQAGDAPRKQRSSKRSLCTPLGPRRAHPGQDHRAGLKCRLPRQAGAARNKDTELETHIGHGGQPGQEEAQDCTARCIGKPAPIATHTWSSKRTMGRAQRSQEQAQY